MIFQDFQTLIAIQNKPFLQSCHDSVRVELNTSVNECEGENACDENATCTDTQASYTCTCNAGFTGSGVVIDSGRTSGDTRGCIPGRF